MKRCWSFDAQNRPTFPEVLQYLLAYRSSLHRRRCISIGDSTVGVLSTATISTWMSTAGSTNGHTTPSPTEYSIVTNGTLVSNGAPTIDSNAEMILKHPMIVQPRTHMAQITAVGNAFYHATSNSVDLTISSNSSNSSNGLVSGCYVNANGRPMPIYSRSDSEDYEIPNRISQAPLLSGRN